MVQVFKITQVFKLTLVFYVGKSSILSGSSILIYLSISGNPNRTADKKRPSASSPALQTPDSGGPGPLASLVKVSLKHIYEILKVFNVSSKQIYEILKTHI